MMSHAASMLRILADAPRRWLWRMVGRLWQHPHGWQGTTMDYVREYWPEELLLLRIFDGNRRFIKPRWWWTKLVSLTLPPDNGINDIGITISETETGNPTSPNIASETAPLGTNSTEGNK